MSIFISIASYQDPLLVSTIFSAYNNARNKDDLIFSICDQSDNPVKVDDLPFANQIRYEHVDPLLQKVLVGQGTELKVFIRRGLFFQIDSHTQFLPNWDILFEDAF